MRHGTRSCSCSHFRLMPAATTPVTISPIGCIQL